MPIFENDGLGHVRVNLIADMTSAELTREFVKSGLPPHPLIAKGLTSVGCDSCTVRSLDPSDSRGGRLELGKPGDGRKMHGECNMHGFEEKEARE
jgi:phosphoadenosine phosphosulfate reductase